MQNIQKILITDTHYGIKNNSTTWLNKQLDFIYKQLIPYIESIKNKFDKVFLYHLGDMFDSRSSISTLISTEVQKAYSALYNVVDEMYIICGNHDFYFSTNSDVSYLPLFFNSVYKETDEGKIKKPIIIKDELYIRDEDLFIPWYQFNNFDVLQTTLQSNPSIRNIFCHADLERLGFDYNKLFEKYQVFSGHIHTPFHHNNYHNLGSTYNLTFADSNDDRGFYTLEKKLEFHKNTHNIRFFHIYLTELDQFDETQIESTDYIIFYMPSNFSIDKQNIKKINKIKSSCYFSKFVTFYNNQNQINEYNINFNQNFDTINIINKLLENNSELKQKFNLIYNNQLG